MQFYLVKTMIICESRSTSQCSPSIYVTILGSNKSRCFFQNMDWFVVRDKSPSTFLPRVVLFMKKEIESIKFSICFQSTDPKPNMPKSSIQTHRVMKLTSLIQLSPLYDRRSCSILLPVCSDLQHLNKLCLSHALQLSTHCDVVCNKGW